MTRCLKESSREFVPHQDYGDFSWCRPFPTRLHPIRGPELTPDCGLIQALEYDTSGDVVGRHQGHRAVELGVFSDSQIDVLLLRVCQPTPLPFPPPFSKSDPF